MTVPTSEVGYTSAMLRREDHEVRTGHEGHWIKKILSIMYKQNIELSHNKSWRLEGGMETCASTIHWYSAQLRRQSLQIHALTAITLRGLICVLDSVFLWGFSMRKLPCLSVCSSAYYPLPTSAALQGRKTCRSSEGWLRVFPRLMESRPIWVGCSPLLQGPATGNL